MIYFEIEDANNNQYYFRIKSTGNNKTLCHSETYKNKKDAEHAIELIKDSAAEATVKDNTQNTKTSGYSLW